MEGAFSSPASEEEMTSANTNEENKIPQDLWEEILTYQIMSSLLVMRMIMIPLLILITITMAVCKLSNIKWFASGEKRNC